MSSLTSLIDLSRNALQADQAALNVTANNVANQNTVGYTNEVVNWSAGDTVTIRGGQSSTSPTVTTTSLRDRVLEQRVQQQTQQQAATSAESDLMSQVENVFSITGSSSAEGSTQLGTTINAMFNSFSALAANPADAATQNAAISAASAMTNAFNAAASGLAGVKTSIDGSLQTAIPAINSLTATIAGLNTKIQALDPNQDAGSLEDQRQTAIAQLSQYVGLHQTTTEANGITLTTSNGSLLVASGQSYQLSSLQQGSTTVIRDSAGTDITATLTGGSVGGQLAAQNVDLPAAQNALDALAYRVGSQINTANQNGLLVNGTPGVAIFSVSLTASGAAAALSVVNPSTNAFAAASVGEGATGNGNATALANLANTVDGNGQTIIGNLAAMLGSIGTSSSALQLQNTSQKASLTQLTTMRDTLSGVNLDTEAANLTTYQRAYQAAAQVLAVVNTLLGSAINIGTESTVA